jgi:hypothetical protein
MKRFVPFLIVVFGLSAWLLVLTQSHWRPSAAATLLGMARTARLEAVRWLHSDVRS